MQVGQKAGGLQTNPETFSVACGLSKSEAISDIRQDCANESVLVSLRASSVTVRETQKCAVGARQR